MKFIDCAKLKMMLLQSIILAVATHSIYAMPQLTFQTDPYRNTFTLKTPSLQQTFTRYYGGQQQVNGLPTVGRLHHQQQQQSLNVQQQQYEQPHQFASAQQYADAYTVPQNFLSDTIQQTQPYQLSLPQRSEYTSPSSLQQPQNYQQQQVYLSNDQQLQQQNYFQQLQSVQPLFFASRQQEQQQQAATAQSQLDSFSSTAVTTPQQQQQPQLQSQENNLLGVAFSPSDQVSHVKFSNGEGLKYNF
ncbi:putative cyclin-dependent serine/threonine-protein kinase DDB_G0272797/DDB_G0274007 isoform X1 [Bradysia coprophila]|uniref:putative cyclin-dependent serine/threonine-protein kinase DDB_G0272797/DDB_G0274007 isoform X1 n=2 Tax=Bradysia coprophila TaxID=38358 RepID=UPI00187D91B8|nr:putative cyclin-dependent serine/threonine-protein kinase DDB_G0272797/DDB_G0274007 isoform X1 [Bradysia coprophila]